MSSVISDKVDKVVATNTTPKGKETGKQPRGGSEAAAHMVIRSPSDMTIHAPALNKSPGILQLSYPGGVHGIKGRFQSNQNSVNVSGANKMKAAKVPSYVVHKNIILSTLS